MNVLRIKKWFLWLLQFTFLILLFLNPRLTSSAYDYADDADPNNAQKIILPHCEEYMRYIRDLNTWTSFKAKDSIARYYTHRCLAGTLNKINNLDATPLKKWFLIFNKEPIYTHWEIYPSFTKFKKQTDTCSINITSKSYNGSPRTFSATGCEMLARNIFFENYKLFGPLFTLNFPVNDDNAISPGDPQIQNSLNDLIILKGKSIYKNDGQRSNEAFCFVNTLKSEVPTVGAACAIDNLCLCATSNVQKLRERQVLLQKLVSLLENPEDAAFVEKQLTILQSFEADYLNLKDAETEHTSIWAENVRYFFYTAAETLQLNTVDNENKHQYRYRRQRGLQKLMSTFSSTVRQQLKKMRRMLNTNEHLFMVLSITAMYLKLVNAWIWPSGIAALFTDGNWKDKPYGTSFPEICRALGLGLNRLLPTWGGLDKIQYATLAQIPGHMLYCIIFNIYLSKTYAIKTALTPPDVGNWWRKLWTLENIIPTSFINKALLNPVNETTNRLDNINNNIQDIFEEFNDLPSYQFHRFKINLQHFDAPIKSVYEVYRGLSEDVPTAFKNSYNQLIGIANFFKASAQLGKFFIQKRTTDPAITSNLKLFDYLEQFTQWMDNAPEKTNETPLDQYRSNSLLAYNEKLQILQEQLDMLEKGFLTKEEKEIQDEAKKQSEILKNAAMDYQDKLECENGEQVHKLLSRLKEQLFREEAAFFKKSTYLPTHIGKIAATYENMRALSEHFYPMYHAISELLAMIALAKKIVLSKKDPFNKYCFVDFEDKRDLPHMKSCNGWNPTAIPTPENGFFHIVPSSFELGGREDGKEQHMLLTGPNGKGKSTFMRGACYQIWAAQTLGIAPAEALSMTPFHFIFSLEKGCGENAAEGKSTHMEQVRIVKELRDKVNILATTKHFSWLNCDELFNGTVSTSASADTCLFLKYLPKESICCVATHQKEAPAAQEKTDGRVVCYKLDPSSKQLEKGTMDMVEESTNASIMERFGYNPDELAEVRALEKEFTQGQKAFATA